LIPISSLKIDPPEGVESPSALEDEGGGKGDVERVQMAASKGDAEHAVNVFQATLPGTRKRSPNGYGKVRKSNKKGPSPGNVTGIPPGEPVMPIFLQLSENRAAINFGKSRFSGRTNYKLLKIGD